MNKNARALHRTFYDPEIILNRCIKKVPKQIRVSFVFTFIFAFVVHMYMFTNKFPNHDDIGHLFGSEYGAASGRWLLPYVLKIHGTFSMPWVIGTLSALFLAVSAAIIVAVMRIKRPSTAIIASALLVSFPAVTATFTYMFSADAYFFALLLACLAAFFTDRYRYGFLVGIAALTLSLGIYQSYFCVTSVLLLGALVLRTIECKETAKSIMLRAAKCLVSLAGALFFYFIIVKLTTRDIELVDYMGISDMGSIELSKLPKLLHDAYWYYYQFFIQNNTMAHFSFLKYAFILTAAATVYLGILLIKKNRLDRNRIFILILFVILYPLAGDIIFLMVPDGTVHILMVYGIVCILIAPLALSDTYYAALSCSSTDTKASPKQIPYLDAACCWVIMLTMVLAVYGYAVFSNEVYMKMDLSYKQAYSYSTRLIGAIESTEGYDINMPIVLLGDAVYGISYEPTPELDRLELTGVADMKALVNSYTYGYFLRRFLGVPNIVYANQSDIAKAYLENEEVIRMPDYPTNGSIKVLDEYIVVKLGG